MADVSRTRSNQIYIRVRIWCTKWSWYLGLRFTYIHCICCTVTKWWKEFHIHPCIEILRKIVVLKFRSSKLCIHQQNLKRRWQFLLACAFRQNVTKRSQFQLPKIASLRKTNLANVEACVEYRRRRWRKQHSQKFVERAEDARRESGQERMKGVQIAYAIHFELASRHDGQEGVQNLLRDAMPTFFAFTCCVLDYLKQRCSKGDVSNEY